MVRQNHVKRQVNEVRQAEMSLEKAVQQRENRAKRRAQAVKMWVMDHNKKLYTRLRGHGHIFDKITMYLVEIEEVEGDGDE